MKQGWKIKKLGDVSDIKTGKSNAVDADVNGKFTFFDRSKKIKKSNRYLFDCEALIIPGEGSQFFPRYYSGKFDLHQRVYSISNFHKSVNIRFVEYFLIFNHKHFENVAVGATVKSLRLRHFTEIEIPLPSLTEQKRIVAILDKSFTAIATAKENAQQNLQNAKELFESYLQNVFENKGDVWEKKRLDEVCKITSKLIDPKESQYKDLIHIGAGNIVSEKGTLIDLKTAKEENLISGKFLFDESMVLYSKIRPYLKKIVKCEFKGLCSADIYPLVPYKDKMIQSFLYHLLSSNHFTEYAIEGSQRAGMPKVNRKHLFEYSFSLPPIKEQQQIVKKLNSLSAETKKLEGIYQQKINDLEELKKSVLEKAFKGELKMVN